MKDINQKICVGLQKAIEIRGSKKAVADLLGISKNAVSKWTQVPMDKAWRLHSILGIPLHELNSNFQTADIN